MKRTINESDFRQAFIDMGRGTQFSYEGLGLLFEALERYDEDCDTETELDVIAICCDFAEEHWSDVAENYSIDLPDCEDDEERLEAVQEYVQENGWLIGTTRNDRIIYQAF